MSQLINTLTARPVIGGLNQPKILYGNKAMPQHSYPSDKSNTFSMGRQSYFRVVRTMQYSPYINNVKTNKPLESSSYIDIKKRNAIGKGSTTINNGPIAFMNQNKNDVRHSLNKVRRIGAAAPPKKGFVRNN